MAMATGRPYADGMDSLFDVVAGLPVHPLVVHFAVVILPLAALLQIAVVLIRGLRARWATLALLGLAAGTVAAFASKESGEKLAERMGLPQTHATWGSILPFIAAVLTVVALVWWVLQRRLSSRRSVTQQPAGLPQQTAGALSAVLAVGVVGLTILVGHSGAVSAWAGRIDDSATTPATTASATPAPAASAAPAASSSSAPAASSSPTASSTTDALTMAAVQKHNSASSCWSAINGNVYDLTAWISAHPGGASPITSLCGTDGTAAFTAQHGHGGRAVNQLATFNLGKLAG